MFQGRSVFADSSHMEPDENITEQCWTAFTTLIRFLCCLGRPARLRSEGVQAAEYHTPASSFSEASRDPNAVPPGVRQPQREDQPLLKGDCNGSSGSSDQELQGMKKGVQKYKEGLEFGSNDEDICPTCLDPYTDENPAITTKCAHQFHLACIYEWLERSQTCPVCSRKMEFEDLA